eukprot:CAMPEP_0203966646 /NCGR_PEP_ID=MMETSP0359-20131031/95819_1 /ASSEMBLY_ACC=CAM_ASM_000338 /TAXON_ID=268821 /ORGANISM="Scrippsiella Hangoei, Strain SHTV-5" /LENGTH=64 /DNA_ID=CAMNT_0050904109 /DNA_START=94 /DNA_END=288 /DNA_ORIENTATION=-
MISALFFFVVGAGIGAFNAEQLKPCLQDTFHLSKQKAAPLAKQASMKISSASVQVKDKINSLRT